MNINCVMQFQVTFLLLFVTFHACESFLCNVLNSNGSKRVFFSHASTRNKKYNIQQLQAVSEDVTQTRADLPGVAEFEQWFQEKCKNQKSRLNNNNTQNYVRHGFFANGRGLEFIGDAQKVLQEKNPVITLPQELILRSVIVEDKTQLESIANDWDVVLALHLLKECQKGHQSDLYGYCMLLTRGRAFASTFPSPPSTAPHCIRNWTDEQKDWLRSSVRGERLLRVQEQQSQEWMQKYEALSPDDRSEFSREQFFWAMEAIHSRAFKGDFGEGNVLKKISKSLIPFAAVAFALNYIQKGPFATDERLTVVLLALSCAPVVLNFIAEKVGPQQMDAVLLPYIDSANHLEAAQSMIEYDPIKGVFTVCIEGKNCILNEESSDIAKRQLYISYGPKRDTELLLNYGFLPNATKDLNVWDAADVDTNEERCNIIRKKLADCFNNS